MQIAKQVYASLPLEPGSSRNVTYLVHTMICCIVIHFYSFIDNPNINHNLYLCCSLQTHLGWGAVIGKYDKGVLWVETNENCIKTQLHHQHLPQQSGKYHLCYHLMMIILSARLPQSRFPRMEVLWHLRSTMRLAVRPKGYPPLFPKVDASVTSLPNSENLWDRLSQFQKRIKTYLHSWFRVYHVLRVWVNLETASFERGCFVSFGNSQDMNWGGVSGVLHVESSSLKKNTMNHCDQGSAWTCTTRLFKWLWHVALSL